MCYVTCVLVDLMAIIAIIAIFTNGNNRNSNLHNRPTLVGKAIGTLHPVLEQFDAINEVASASGVHSKPKSVRDTSLVVQELNQAKVFEQKEKRKHSKIRTVKPLLHHKPDKLVEWMTGHLKHLAK